MSYFAKETDYENISGEDQLYNWIMRKSNTFEEIKISKNLMMKASLFVISWRETLKNE